MLVGNQVLMMWNPVPGATGYIVYRNGKAVARVTTNQHLEPVPKRSGEYRYQIAAVGPEGVEGERSEPGLVKVRHLEAPKRVVVRPDPATGTLGLLWDQVEGAVIYNVYRSAAGEPFELLASVQDVTYVDGEVRPGTRYRYRVTARDATGTESDPSPVAEAEARRPPKRGKKPKVFRALPTRELYRLDRVGDDPLTEVSFLGLDPEGGVWVVTPRTGRIHRLDPAGNEERVFGPFTSDRTGFILRPHKLAFAPGGGLYVTDAWNGVLARLTPEGEMTWARGLITPPPQDEEVWEDFPDRVKSLPPTPSSVAVVGDEIWVTDQRFQLLYRFAPNGDLLGYLAHAKRGKETFRLPAVGEVAALGGGNVVLTFPLSHYAAVLDPEGNVVAEFGTGVKGYIGGFVGIHGVQPFGDHRILFTDPAVGTLQVFDVSTGNYLYHVSGEEPRPDPQYRERADLPIRKPNMAVTNGRGRFWVYDAATRTLVCLEQAGPVTPALGSE
ncbi:hypothetical protein [Deferrisoma camini]|uniref:hypothetical protein n=1 Tax=Deferrisoma camini TaxID=1035120 RepID=UPI00046D25DB|nr:hypothetical protein [Deferrisoma camini]